MEITVFKASANLKAAKKQRQEGTVQNKVQIKDVTPSGKPCLSKLSVSPKITKQAGASDFNTRAWRGSGPYSIVTIANSKYTALSNNNFFKKKNLKIATVWARERSH